VDVSPEQAVAAGAMALFGEKYGDKVRVVSVPGFSMELCGGTQVHATGDIGFFVILAESGVAAGVRRIEAVTGAGAVEWAQQQRAAFHGVIDALKVNPSQAVEAVERLHAENRKLARDASELKTRLAVGGGGNKAAYEPVDVGGVTLVAQAISAIDKDGLRTIADQIRNQIKSGIVVLASAGEGKVHIIVAVTPDLTSRIKAGQIVKDLAPIVGGAGGGRPDFAEAGGKHPEKIAEMLTASQTVVTRLLAG
jgi:alanyl-tRNA synthetase